jgi:glutathione S-transferase
VLLYDSPVSGNCYKVRLILAYLGLPYERRTMDVADRSNRPDVLGGLNPALRVPTLVLDDGRPLAESGAILWYFGEGTPLVPDDRYERAQVLQWMFFEQYDHEPSIAVVRFWVAYSGRAEAFADRIEERRAAGYRALDAMERRLDGRRLPRWGLADACRHRAVRLHTRGARGRLRPLRVRGDQIVAGAGGGDASARSDRRLSVGETPLRSRHGHVTGFSLR